MEFGEVKDEKLDSYSASEDMKWYSHSVQQFSSVLICRATITKNQRLVIQSLLDTLFAGFCFVFFSPSCSLSYHPLLIGSAAAFVQQFSSISICRATITKNQRLVMYPSLCWICYLQLFFPPCSVSYHPLNSLCCRVFLVFSFKEHFKQQAFVFL